MNKRNKRYLNRVSGGSQQLDNFNNNVAYSLSNPDQAAKNLISVGGMTSDTFSDGTNTYLISNAKDNLTAAHVNVNLGSATQGLKIGGNATFTDPSVRTNATTINASVSDIYK